MERNALNCICGVSLEKVLDLEKECNLEIIQLTEGNYAIVDGDCYNDTSVYALLLLSWINDNNLLKDNTLPFTIYEMNESSESKSIKTKTYIKLKDVKNQ